MAGHLILPRRTLGLPSLELPQLPDPLLDAGAVMKEGFLNTEFAATIVKRGPQATSSSSALAASSCAPDDTSPRCEKPVSSSNTTLPIVLGIVIPLIAALVIFIILHRRHVRKLRSEDANDRHKSLDFGMGHVKSPGGKAAKPSKKGKAMPEMRLTDTEKTVGRGRGLSMDLDMTNPYLLPPELQQSRESLHSMSRTVNNGDDKYRPATTFITNDGSIREGSSSRGADDSSIYTASTRRAFGEKENESDQSLLRYAQRMSRSMPPTRRTSVTSAGSTPMSQDPEHSNKFPRKLASQTMPNENLAPLSSEPNRDSYRSDISREGRTAGLRKSNDYLGAFIRSGGPSAVESKLHEEKPRATTPPPQHEPAANVPDVDIAPLPKHISSPEPLNFEFPAFDDSVPVIKTDAPESEMPAQEASLGTDRQELGKEQYEQDFDYDVRRLTMGIRPLPPDDPTEDPEQRAIRIRSFYKEYFDDAKPGPVYTQQDYQPVPEGLDYEGSIYDDAPRHIVSRAAPFAQPMARRAMTPPPRGASSLQAPGRNPASSSGGHLMQPGPRAFSSASAQGPPRKKVPPPAPLQILPTPHLLKDDSIIPMDFAPPSFRERRAGTPDSLRGGLRPYSPVLPAHLPLTSSFDDLAVMPSP